MSSFRRPPLIAVLAVLLAVLCLTVAACGDDSDEGSDGARGGGGADGDSVVLGFTSDPPDVPAIGDARQGAIDAGKKLGVEVKFAHAPDAAGQQTAVENLLAGGVDVLAIDPNDSTAIGSAVQAANAQDVPVIMWIGDNLGDGETATFISSSEEDGGKALGEYMVERLGGEGSVALINGPKAHQAFQLREKGFRGAVEGTGVSIDAYGDGGQVEDKANTLATNMLTKEPNLVAMSALSDAMAAGTLKAVEAQGGGDPPLVTGYNGDCPTLHSIWEGKTTATLYQGWYEIGAMTVEVAKQIADGKDVPPEILVPPFMVDKEVMRQIQDGSFEGVDADRLEAVRGAIENAVAGCKG
jgi:ribose transport system substrate-binding protein